MTAQDKEIAQLHDAMVQDLNGLVNKYMKIVGWDVPENDEKEALQKITATLQKALKRVENTVQEDTIGGVSE